MIIYGASGHGKVILEILELCGVNDVEFWDDEPLKTLWEKKVSSPVLNNNPSNDKMIVAIGNNRIRKNIAQKIGESFTFINAIHPNCTVSRRAIIDGGTVVMASAVINSDTKIGKHCIINSGAVVEHDCIIDNFVHISPKTAIGGNVKIKEGAHIGIGATVIQGIKIGKWVTVGAGSVIIEDIPDYAIVVGCPGKIIKYNDPI